MRLSNIKNYKYDWIWKKNTSTGFQHAKNMPLKNYENISIFSKGSMGHKNLLGNKRMIYNPQGIVKIEKVRKASKNQWGGIVGKRPSHKEFFISEYTNYPLMVLDFNSEINTIHSTQKPIALLEYLIKTYSNEGDLILDNCSGSGSLAIAAYNTHRNFICIEKNEEYYKKSVERLESVRSQLRLF